MWWRLTLLVIALMLVFFVAGLYAGGAMFLQLTQGHFAGLSWDTLWEARKLPWNDRRMLYVPWSWCVTAALTFLPVGVTLMAVFVRLKPKTSLHGDARFANDHELRQFEYQGEYKNTSKASK
ncbi:hypothetical protein ALQ72_200051 [Pseudomonas syringae pv. maculicola]|uniref:hypothetical protein n=1 Tax=Pseudomonas syringae group genomosp. 3 TaxID=251701 RepID=UPI0006B8978A|nr:hypothetical protein [Pseudomonas syringae group genomosp. 3]KPC00457.1 Uncharacterized protein AC503_5618 [Pseudomonas syringae pv. maculicola]MBM0211710.1 hypothetical protein [Pseudomonas syringae pv. maculicola]RMM70702.1 hypothetical protein ALQ72_200051 [Pseudomonas syringae pv. maculicola]